MPYSEVLNLGPLTPPCSQCVFNLWKPGISCEVPCSQVQTASMCILYDVCKVQKKAQRFHTKQSVERKYRSREIHAVMAFNLTGIDPALYFSVSTAVNVGLFSFIAVPALILCVLCVLALFLAKDIIWHMRVLLINIFAADICVWIGISVLFLGLPVRVSNPNYDGDFSCNVFMSCAIISTIQKFSSITLYAIMVYIFIKRGVKHLKWYPIILYFVVSWIFAFLVGILPYFDLFGLFKNNGFCYIDPEALFFKLCAGLTVAICVIMLCIIILFGILTFIYIKKNTLEENEEIKKAVAKNLIFAAIFSLVYNVTPAFFPLIRDALVGKSVIIIIIINYIIRVFLNLPTIFTPIAAMIILKPIRLALKQVVKCAFCKKNEE